MTAYPELIAIPFNQACIRDAFVPLAPQSPAPSGPGFWVLLQGGGVILQGSGPRPCLPEGELPAWVVPEEKPFCLGWWKGRPLRLCSVASRCAVPPPFVTEILNAPEQRVDDATLTICGLAKQLLHWDLHSRFCPRCGGATRQTSSGWSKRCSECSTKYFPHLHPCAIVLVRRDQEILLIHKAEWPVGRYSLVAGYQDPGESLEECAAREVREETGIEIADIRYVGSQNWPFPSQMMAGFVAQYAGGEIVVDRKEIEDARWFPVQALPALPPRRSIARRIIETFGR